MKLSVVIVNYNVRAYLEQCLRTVFRAMEGIDGEVFVVDNLSTDGSVEMVREKFPEVELIANKENVGFSRANNQAIRLAKGEFVLLLNPDTVVGEDVFSKVLAFLDSHPKAGGLGVKMIDGTGTFLRESKRGLPTPQVAFFKIIGLTRLFPRSKVFGRYHLGHLPENEAAPIEILSGACMFLRKKTLDEVGLLDESFFMYGEDIDLSYRITLGGYENWYFPEARIIHYKGESTKKSSVNYVFVFYNAMAIFAQKHFTGRGAGIFPLLIKGSIYLSAAAAIAVRFLDRMLLPILDLFAVLVGLAFIPIVPEMGPMARELGIDLILGLIIVGWIGLFGAYDRPLRFLPPVIGLVALVVLGSFLLWVRGNDLMSFRGMLLPVGTCAILLLGVRAILHWTRVKGYGMRRRERERILAIGSPQETRHAIALLWQTHYGLGWTGSVDPDEQGANTHELATLLRKKRVGEVVFCSRDMAWGRIIEQMEALRDHGAVFKIAQPGREFIIGPNSIESLSDLYMLEGHALSSPGARRHKRIVDVMVALLVLVGFPISAWLVKRPAGLARNAWEVLRGSKSWVGYRTPQSIGPKLPVIPPGVIDPGVEGSDGHDPLVTARMNATYAKNYSPWEDLRLMVRGFPLLGRA